MLSHKQDGKVHPVAYASVSLSPTEKMYCKYLWVLQNIDRLLSCMHFTMLFIIGHANTNADFLSRPLVHHWRHDFTFAAIC